MDKVKILHCGDIHFDTPFQSLNNIDAEKRKEDLRETFGRIIDLIKSESIPILLMAGDIFDNEGVTKMTMDYIDKKLREIPNTKVFIAPGNHDYYHSKSFYSIYSWPNNVHIFKDKIEKIYIPDLKTCIYGVGFSKNHEKQTLIQDFIVDGEDTINIMVLHGDVVGTGNISDYNPLTDVNIKNTKLDYLALGHKHSFSDINKSGQTYWSYCGNPEGRGFDELGTKGIVLGEVGKGWCDLRFIDISKRKYIEIQTDISNSSTYEDIVNIVKEITKDTEIHKNFYRVILMGEIEKDLLINKSLLEDKLKEYFYFVEIIDKTTISLDYDELEKEYSLRGIFARKTRERILASQELEDKDILELALKIGLAVLDKGKVNIE